MTIFFYLFSFSCFFFLPTNSTATMSTHPLQTPWTWYYDRKLPKGQIHDYYSFEKNLVKLGTVNTVEGFWNLYAHLILPSHLSIDSNYYFFRNNAIPAWETFPKGGCWIVHISKRNGLVNRLWEELLFACIGELFEEPEVMGVVLSSRGKHDIISVWNRDNVDKPTASIHVGEKLKTILNLDVSTQLEYKQFFEALKDGSTHRNAMTFAFVAKTDKTDAEETRVPIMSL